MAAPPAVPVMVEVPAVVEDLNVAVYVPLLLSVTDDSVPNVLLSVTVAPPEVRLFPFTSFSCTIIVVVLVPLAVIDEEEAVINEVEAETAAGTNVITSLSVIDTPATLPVIVQVPAVVDEVRVAVYVPLLLSTTAERLPSVLFKTIVAPPAVKLFPFASFNCTVIVEVLVPFAVMDEGEDEIKEVAPLADPGTKLTVSLSVIVTPPTVPVIVEVPVVVEEVRVAVYVPLLLSVIAEREPSVLLNVTVAPPVVRLLPFASLS
jgi:hypothetical protein